MDPGLHKQHIAGHLVEYRPADRSGDLTGQASVTMGPDDEQVSLPDSAQQGMDRVIRSDHQTAGDPGRNVGPLSASRYLRQPRPIAARSASLPRGRA